MISILTLGSRIQAAPMKKDAWTQACAAARHSEFRQKVEAYRQLWLATCNKAETTVDLVPLIESARAAEKAGVTFVGSHSPSEADQADEFVSNKLATFLPFFQGSIMEYTSISPSLGPFAEIAEKKGTADDKAFFRIDSKLGERDGQPWLELRWDYGGCIRYGEYNWSLYLGALEKAEGFKVLDFIGKKTLLDPAKREGLVQRYKSIQAGTIKIRSDAAGECSYG